MCAELATLDSLPFTTNNEFDTRDLKKLDNFYVASMSTKRAKRDNNKIEKMVGDVVKMRDEFGLPNAELVNGVKGKTSIALRYDIYAKQLSIENLKENSKKVSGMYYL